MKKYLPVLRKCPLFRHIAEEDLLRMLDCLGARIAAFDKKYTILAEGRPAKYIGILLSGSAQLSRVDYYGNRSILSKAEPADIFGEAFACAEVASLPVTVIADEPCEVMFIDSMHILHTCANGCGFHQQLIFNLMKDLAEKNLALHQKIQITSQRSTRDKLMTYLQLQAQKADSSTFSIPLDRQELADYLKVDRSGLSAEISKLRREGVLESHRKTFTLL
ncbi:MAG: Crp/Fnr family transcriptional regulator [Clostridia bacterium]|nr:Crp/Fnr family transcriptional regulator [Clostridia bacterium]